MKWRGIAYNEGMKIKNTFVVSAMAIAASCASLADGVRISISPDAKGIEMPKTMYGIFFEDINYAADGGIYPELLANRGFDWKTKDLEGWEADYRGGAMARITVQENAPLHPNTARHLRMECFGPGTGCGVRNKGFHGVSVEAGKKYDLTFYARHADSKDMPADSASCLRTDRRLYARRSSRTARCPSRRSPVRSTPRRPSGAGTPSCSRRRRLS